ncbi:hypothetical protein [Stratiformator vulcanicus]|uniref:Uncharacterized protein n=1 Tax=Stratiformator vulcanicus TaxID=2527980 RepID=A0A517R6V3_9PLAN|nr:hypothetical protein [Stratiformator vulcanicus]QDT39618.1 hypothetical protein Pan189_40270 [Stratiformator vulcanicus]
MDNPTTSNNRIRSQAQTTLILSCLWLTVLIVFAGHSYYRYQRLTDVDRIVAQATEALKKDYPEMRAMVIMQVNESAPDIAEGVSQSLIQAAPDVRKEARKFIARQIDAGSDQLIAVSSVQFQEFVESNHDQVEEWIEQLDAAPDEIQEIAEQIDDQVGELVGEDLQQQLDTILAGHEKLNDRLSKIARSGHLSPTELIELRIVRILKALQLKYVEEVNPLAATN